MVAESGLNRTVRPSSVNIRRNVMRLLVFELNSFHTELLPMYQPLLPSLFGDQKLDIDYYLLPTLVSRARDMVGSRVEALNTPLRIFALAPRSFRTQYYRKQVQRLVDRLQPEAVLFNTIEPPEFFHVFRELSHPLKIGVVHNPRRKGIDYGPRAAGELIFCLHDYNYRLLEQDKPVDGYLSPFYGGLNSSWVPASDGCLQIAVQGLVSFK